MFSVLAPLLLVVAFSFPLVADASGVSTTTSSAPLVPFYSQFKDITSPKWQKVGCGIASLAMVIDYYATTSPSVNKILSQGIALNAYSSSGWTYSGLISVARTYGLVGETRVLYGQNSTTALESLKSDAAKGPIIASVHYKFDPTNPIPHLVVVDRIEDGEVYYNDPAARAGNKKISLEAFLASWKKRYIVLRPA